MGKRMRRLSAALLPFLLLLTGCSLQFTVPDVAGTIAPPPVAEKIPLRAAIILDESETQTKTFNLGVNQTFTVPVGQMLRQSALAVFPAHFDQAAIVRSQQEAGAADLLFVPTVTDFGLDTRMEGFSTNYIQARVSVRVIASEAKGLPLWDKSTTSPWVTKIYNGLSTDEFLRHFGLALQEATATAMKDALRGLGLSRVFKGYVASRTGGGAAPAVAAAVPVSAPAPAAPPPAMPLRSDAFAVVIGIDYQGREDVPALKYASQDARQVHALLTDPRYGGVPKENALLILNEKATRNEMIAALRRIKTWPGYVYVYYSGYGAAKTRQEKLQDGLIVPADAVLTDPDALEDTGITLTYLRELVSTSQAKGVLVALDAGFTGGGKSVVPKGGRPLVGMLAAPALVAPQGANRVIITASALNQPSWEEERELKGGIFSHFLIEGMKGKTGRDPWVRADQLAGYVRENVTAAARRLKGAEQVPQVTGSGDFAVTRNWEGSQAADGETARSKLKAALERGAISVDQVNRAMRELASPGRSKTLDAFLQGKIDEKQFGELY